MLPTPDTSHVPYARVYEPAEDSFLLLDTLSAASEITFLASRFSSATEKATPPLVLEVGPGSGVVLAFLTAHAATIFGTTDILTLGVDINRFACAATRSTVSKAVEESASTAGSFLGAVQGDLVGPVRSGAVDVLVFNPPYVPTDELPAPPVGIAEKSKTTFEEDSHLLALSYAGGRDGMETTDRLIAALPDTLSGRGCAYLLLCAGNRPEDVKQRIREFGPQWGAETVGTSGKTAGWEKLQIVRIWRELVEDSTAA
ncbi:methyltransferase domain-containing protein [Podospora aff. communis PSN243]|uniref:Methyltransferase domain-containing protein n=1 Tax=Podospora aff. communis PSN243 TaxID=3040156 RepID=A0AAV9GU26_9PEZI|nr:methyltransferase domain-containing protein [Podospora aff. communis PSN243]